LKIEFNNPSFHSFVIQKSSTEITAGNQQNKIDILFKQELLPPMTILIKDQLGQAVFGATTIRDKKCTVIISITRQCNTPNLTIDEKEISAMITSQKINTKLLRGWLNDKGVKIKAIHLDTYNYIISCISGHTWPLSRSNISLSDIDSYGYIYLFKKNLQSWSEYMDPVCGLIPLMQPRLALISRWLWGITADLSTGKTIISFPNMSQGSILYSVEHHLSAMTMLHPIKKIRENNMTIYIYGSAMRTLYYNIDYIDNITSLMELNYT